MEERVPILKVHEFGGFHMTYGGQPVSLGRSTATKAARLLQILISHGENGVVRGKLMEELYGWEELADAANNLRVTVYRLKKLLKDGGLPSYDYVQIKKGIYFWVTPVKMESDAQYFRELLNPVKGETEEDRARKAIQACQIYRGEYLPDLADVDDILVESVQYKKMYAEALKEACIYLIRCEEYEEALQLCTPACELYPFDEWQSIKIECYMGMKKYEEAMQVYYDTAQLLFDELGVRPSERMMKQFEIMSSHVNYSMRDMKNIQKGLGEEAQERGAYYCSLPSFRDNYRLLSRLIERSGQSVYLMMCSLTNGKGQPLQNEQKLKVMSEQLYDSIKHCLRRGDSFTKYSATQFLALLAGTDREQCEMIYERVRRYFCREHKSWSTNLEFYVSSVADADREDSKIHLERY